MVYFGQRYMSADKLWPDKAIEVRQETRRNNGQRTRKDKRDNGVTRWKTFIGRNKIFFERFVKRDFRLNLCNICIHLNLLLAST